MTWLQSILYGLLSGLTDILPVSAQAHQVLLLKLYGIKDVDTGLLDLMVHLAILGGLYFTGMTQLSKISRARALARIPKRRRRRPLDTRSLMDFSMLKTMAIPVILALLLYRYAVDLKHDLVRLSAFLLINGVALYLPQFFPGSNRDARTLTPVGGLLIGLGGAVSVLPGASAIGLTTSIASVCGVDRSYGLNMALLLDMLIMAGYAVYDCIAIVQNNTSITFLALLQCLISALAAFVGTVGAVKFMRYLARNRGYALFGLYCAGLALFTFILNLMA